MSKYTVIKLVDFCSWVPIGSRVPVTGRVWWSLGPAGGYGGGWRWRGEVAEAGMEVANPPPYPAGATQSYYVWLMYAAYYLGRDPYYLSLFYYMTM
jgi:hypothetical protein